MQKTALIAIFTWVLALSTPVASFAQEGETNHKKRLKELEQKKQEQEAEEAKYKEEMRERQKDIQSKDVRKRMKKANKKANRTNTNKSESIWVRIFRGKKR